MSRPRYRAPIDATPPDLGVGTPGPVTLATADGVRLAGAWDPAAAARAVVVALHPHPLMGGDLRQAVPTALAERLPRVGVSVLRIDFRGAGRSEGTHQGGAVETADVAAAVGWVSSHEPGRPIVVAGYSFGASVAAHAVDPSIGGWVLITPPLGVDEPPVATDDRPTRVVAARHDQFVDIDDLLRRTATWRATTTRVIEGTDHFLAGALDTVVDEVAALADELSATRPG